MMFPLLSQFNPGTGEVSGVTPKVRRLDGLKGYFVDEAAYRRALGQENPVVYSVSSVEPAQGDGQLHYGVGKLMPGRIGREYFFTAGHFHAYRPAAEFYIGLSGEGLMLLQHETSGETRVQPLRPDTAVYVPGYTAHRTINCGETPLIYLGIYPAQAGHDYGLIAERNFDQVVLEVNGQPAVMPRRDARALIEKDA
jgi:glucose-6-phosphate isomerase